MPDDYIKRDEFEHYKEKDLDRQQSTRDALGAKLDSLKDYITKEFRELREELDEKYVTRREYEPLKKIVYGAVGLILVAVLGGIVALVLI